MSLRVHVCTTEALAVQWVCILALTSCSFLYANSSFVCWQAHWQLHVGWGKAPVRIKHGASAAPQTTSQQMENAEKCGLCVSNLLFWHLFCTHSIGTCHTYLGHEVCTVGQWGLSQASVTEYSDSLVSHYWHSSIFHGLFCFNSLQYWSSKVWCHSCLKKYTSSSCI